MLAVVIGIEEPHGLCNSSICKFFTTWTQTVSTKNIYQLGIELGQLVKPAEDVGLIIRVSSLSPHVASVSVVGLINGKRG